MTQEKHSTPVLTTPKGVFWTGFALGALTALSFVTLLALTRPFKGAVLRPAPSVGVPAADLLEEQQFGDPRPVGPDDHMRGSGPVTIIEYSDLECPFCKRHHETMKRVIAEREGVVRWIYRHFPLTQLHSKAQKEAEAAECAGEQGRFWEFIDRLFEVTPANNGLDLAALPKIAKEAGVKDAAKFQKCLDDEKYRDRVNADARDAVNVGADGTPYNMILAPNGVKDVMPGAVEAEQLIQLIDALKG